MRVKKNYITKSTEYTVTYTGMRGVDFSSDIGNPKRHRFSYLENMYKDYSGGGEGITESVPGFRKISTVNKRVHAIYTHKNSHGEEYAVVHAGDSLYRFAVAERDKAFNLSPIITLSDSKSCGFTSGSDLYILDGTRIIKVDDTGVAATVSDQNPTSPYVPTTYYNGEEYEQRNLLTDKFIERYLITLSSDFAAESVGLNYRIISEEEKTAGVASASPSLNGVVYIPSYTTIAGVRYKVTEICDNAFHVNRNIVSVHLSEYIKKIGRTAFKSCINLKEVFCKNGVEIIGSNAFLGCETMTTLYLGTGIKEIGVCAFGACFALKSINYAGDKESFEAIDNQASYEGITINYGVYDNNITVEIPIFSPAINISSVTVDGTTVNPTLTSMNGRYTSVILRSTNAADFDGKELCITGTMDQNKFTKNSEGTNFMSIADKSITGKAAILGCTVCESFDGRVFLSGNPALPNTVFYSSRDSTGRNNPTYFGVLNYFNDGTGTFPVKSLLSAGDSLAVFKSGDDGGGSIYYHTPKETGINILPKIYPVSYIHSGISARGESISFFDDPVFISDLGLSALDKKMINLERSIVCRSNNVNEKLLSENLENISMTKWCGYLVLLAEGHIYLADSRQMFTNEYGNVEYEWYYLSGIGTYKNSTILYKFSERAKDGFFVKEDQIDQPVTTGIYVGLTDKDETVYFTTIKGKKYEVCTEHERVGGTFSPASAICSAGGDILFFGTKSGDICVFNNDMRGVPPFYIKEQKDFDEDEYNKHFGKRIHPYFYSFDEHAPFYALSTVSDNGGIPHLTKSTVKNSLAAKLKCFGKGYITCEVGTDKSGYKEVSRLPALSLNFSEFDFSALSFSNNENLTIPIKERERGWIEKKVTFYTGKYMSPFGLYSVSYRFNVKGKIKY